MTFSCSIDQRPAMAVFESRQELLESSEHRMRNSAASERAADAVVHRRRVLRHVFSLLPFFPMAVRGFGSGPPSPDPDEPNGLHAPSRRSGTVVRRNLRCSEPETAPAMKHQSNAAASFFSNLLVPPAPLRGSTQTVGGIDTTVCNWWASGRMGAGRRPTIEQFGTGGAARFRTGCPRRVESGDGGRPFRAAMADGGSLGLHSRDAPVGAHSLPLLLPE